jgi:hypothetical protein
MRTPNNKTKKRYTNPRLTKLGPIGKLTHGGTGTAREGNGANKNDPDRRP